MSSYGSYQNPFGNLSDLAKQFQARRGAPVSPEQHLKAAQAAAPGGRQVGSDWVTQGAGGFSYSTPLSYYNPAGYNDPYSGPENALLSSFLRDANVFQGAGDRQYARNNEQIAGYQSALDAGLAGAQANFGQALGVGTQGLDQFLSNQQQNIGEAGQAADQFGQAIPGIMAGVRAPIQKGMQDSQQLYDKAMGFQAPDLQSDARAAFGEAQKAESGYAQGITDFKNASWDDAQAIADGIRSSMKDAETQALSTTNPDGSPKTAAQAAADRYMFNDQSQRQVSSIMSQFSGKIRDTQAQMEGVLAGLGMQTADFRGKIGDAKAQEAALNLSALGVAGQAASLVSQFSGQNLQAGQFEGEMQSKLADLELQKGQARQQYDQFIGAWNQNRMSLMSTFPLQALQMEMQGRGTMAQLVQQNPETQISWFESLLGLYSAMAQARGTTAAGGGSGGVFRSDGRGGQVNLNAPKKTE